MLNAVIMDLDSVILDIEPIRIQALIETINEYGVHLTEAICQSFSDSTDFHKLEALRRIYHLPVPTERLVSEFLQRQDKLVRHKGYPIIPDSIEFIYDLFRNKIKIGIISSTSRNRMDAALDYLKLRPYIAASVSAHEVANEKPEPDIMLTCADQMKETAENCLVIEDSAIGLLAAKTAGMARIGFLNTNTGKQNMDDVEYVIEGFHEVNTKFILHIYQRLHEEPVTIRETERLIIRELSVNDISRMYQIYQSKEIREFVDDIDDYLAIEIEKHRAYIKNVYTFYGYGYWGVFDKNTQELIGRCGIQNNIIDDVPEIELGYLIATSHWGKGFGHECTEAVLDYAINELHIPRIVAQIDRRNERSIKLASDLGMEFEKVITKDGHSCDLYVITPKIFNHQ